MLPPGAWPVWLVVGVCGLLNQIIKLIMYSLARRHVALPALAQGNGLPSLQVALLSCLVVVVSLRSGWGSAEAGFVLVFAVIVVHDTIKLAGLADRQREALSRILEHLEGAGTARQRMAEFLDPRAHHPAHVAVGAIFGALFALAFGVAPG